MDAEDIGRELALINDVIGKGSFCEGLLITGREGKGRIFPVFTTKWGKMVVDKNSDDSISLYPITHIDQSLLQPSELIDGQIKKEGYLSFLKASDFRFAGEITAGVFDARKNPVTCYATKIFAIASQASQTIEQRERLLETINSGLFLGTS